MKTTGTTYTITELKELGKEAAYRNALTWLHEQTGIPAENEDDLVAEAEAFRQTFTWTGRPVRN